MIGRVFTARFGQALRFADDWHRGHFRKGTDLPYISHLLAVAALVMEHGGDEDQAISALLHDVIEDRAGPDPEPLKRDIESEFGTRVLATVLGCSDAHGPEEKAPWKARKQAYIAHLAEASDDVLLVSCADKVHNLRTILVDYRQLGEGFWTRFSVAGGDPWVGRAETLWYYRELARAFRARLPALPAAMLDELVDVLRAVQELAAQRGARFSEDELQI